MQLFVEQVYKVAQSNPDSPALLSRDLNSVSYATLWRKTGEVRSALARIGIQKGERVILAATRDFSFIYTYLALHAQGIIAVPLDPRTPKDIFNFIKEQVNPRLIIWPEKSVPQSQEFSFLMSEYANCSFPEIERSSLADIMFTSGTTGYPKGVLLTHGNIASAVNNINSYILNSNSDVEICPMPLSHSFGIARLRCVLYAGGGIVLEDGVNRPKHLFETIERFHATGLGLVGPAWALLYKLSGNKIGRFSNQLRYLELGSAPLEPSLKKTLANLLPNTKVCMHYGLTEASRSAFLDLHADVENIGSVGKAGPLVEIAVCRPDGSFCEVNEQGEVCVRGNMVSKGYLNKEEGCFFPGGFFRTGDLGCLNDKGYLYLHGRIKETINVGGEKVSPQEIEMYLTAIEGIEEAACIGQPDPVLGEVVVAFVVANADSPLPSSRQIQLILRENLETYKIPARIIEIKAIPRTNSGKIKRLSLKELL